MSDNATELPTEAPVLGSTDPNSERLGHKIRRNQEEDAETENRAHQGPLAQPALGDTDVRLNGDETEAPSEPEDVDPNLSTEKTQAHVERNQDIGFSSPLQDPKQVSCASSEMTDLMPSLADEPGIDDTPGASAFKEPMESEMITSESDSSEAKELSSHDEVDSVALDTTQETSTSVVQQPQPVSAIGEQHDVDSQAAVALAAVAVAASAAHRSPAAAALAARALVPGIVPEAAALMTGHGRKEMADVDLGAVKLLLKQKEAKSVVLKSLADGQNDGLLQFLLLLQYFQPDENSIPKVHATRSGSAENQSTPEKPVDVDLVGVASEKVIAMLGVIESAYDSVVSLLPLAPELEPKGDTTDFDGIEAPFYVPDLLPPCISSPGDATIGFFLACSGVNIAEQGSEADAAGGEPLFHEPHKQADSKEMLRESSGSSSGSHSHSTTSTSMFSMFSGKKHGGAQRHTARSSRGAFSSVFRKKNRHQNKDNADKVDKNRSSLDDDLLDGEYAVVIEREMLGLTVENVLERTVVRTVLPGGAAKKAGAKVGSLIVKVGNTETKNLTHFETIDELRQSNRPLRLVMRQISSDGLRLAREEMGRLIRGGGFGTLLNGVTGDEDVDENIKSRSLAETRGDGKAFRAEVFWHVLQGRFSTLESQMENKKETSLLHASEKLAWILTILVVGLEREAAKLLENTDEGELDDSPRERHSHYRHSAKDFADAARSASKVLHDFIHWRLSPPKSEEGKDGDKGNNSNVFVTRKGRRVIPPPPPPGAMSASAKGKTTNLQSALFRIGDVLHRTRTFLADPTSPPAALLRSEVIAFLCDILDIDTGMELAEEESASSTAGGKATLINDLGSAGSLLKLIILNCSMMRSPECLSSSLSYGYDSALNKRQSDKDPHRMHAGNRFLAVVHRLAASRSVSARVTACSLGPVLWGHLDFPHQLQLRGVITRALHDVDVSVRKSTAAVLHEIAELVFDPRSVPWLVLMCERAMTDPEPQLRSAAMTLTWHLAEHLPNAFLGDASKGSRSLSRLPPRTDPTFAEVYLLQCKLLPVATRLAEDRAPSVRLAVAAQCDRLCNALGEHWFSVIIDVLQALLSDTDERVRGEAILCVPRLVETVLLDSSPSDSQSGGVSVLEALLPLSIKLQKDPSASVRVALASAAGELLTLLVGLETLEEISSPNLNDSASISSDSLTGFRRHKKHVDQTLIPLLQQLLHDTDPEVTSSALRAVTNASRGNVREIRARRSTSDADDDALSLSSYHSHASLEKKDPVFIPVLSESQVLRLIPTLSELANSKQWRVRQGAVEIVPALLGCTSKLQTRSEIAQLCIRLMGDRVDAVRRTAAECLCLGGGALGSHGEGTGTEWITAIVIPQVRNCGQHPDSRQRMLSLKMIQSILMNGVCPSKKVALSGNSEKKAQTSPLHDLLEVAVSLSTDRVANVRLNVGRLLGDVIHVLEHDDLLFVTKVLQEQLEDENRREGGGDRDVLYYAKRSISRAQLRLEEVSVNIDTEGANDSQGRMETSPNGTQPRLSHQEVKFQ